MTRPPRLPRRVPRAEKNGARLRAATDLGLNLSAWIRDYAYALRRQASGLLRGPDPQAYRRPDSQKPAVLLLPGIYETWAFMQPVANVLREGCYDVHAVVDLGYNGGTIADMADLVDEHIRRERIGRCVLVAHSKGGLIGKLLLTRRLDSDLILGMVTLNTPFEGSPLARLLPLPAIRLFLPRSPELTELGASQEVNSRIVSIYGRFDPHIPGGSHLEGAHNVQLGTRGHFLPLGRLSVHEAILEGVRRISHREDTR
ncbi:esterase/lipase family protein [Nesterenkonia sandarakina]|uniref:Pimeloyl-ACP methyl ester carboxylesterase n=1 Tax=Nesterenkonia sandarakina TaxID=272918 RepID=A0A2T0YCQ8_9MICC|nr:alpha/beta hydrolase [Nesterenkonia sandarakina]PRZ12560.1 pimeloyl-ACP methyl ester carboxylesterase [Nesterenkonia sandarakina]